MVRSDALVDVVGEGWRADNGTVPVRILPTYALPPKLRVTEAPPAGTVRRRSEPVLPVTSREGIREQDVVAEPVDDGSLALPYKRQGPDMPYVAPCLPKPDTTCVVSGLRY